MKFIVAVIVIVCMASATPSLAQQAGWELSEIQQIVAGHHTADYTQRTLARFATERLCNASKDEHIHAMQRLQIYTPHVTVEPWGYRHQISPEHEQQVIVVCTSTSPVSHEPIDVGRLP